jgi:hypothetical protein
MTAGLSMMLELKPGEKRAARKGPGNHLAVASFGSDQRVPLTIPPGGSFGSVASYARQSVVR